MCHIISGYEGIMRTEVVREYECSSPTHLIKNSTLTNTGCVTEISLLLRWMPQQQWPVLRCTSGHQDETGRTIHNYAAPNEHIIYIYQTERENATMYVIHLSIRPFWRCSFHTLPLCRNISCTIRRVSQKWPSLGRFSYWIVSHTCVQCWPGYPVLGCIDHTELFLCWIWKLDSGDLIKHFS